MKRRIKTLRRGVREENRYSSRDRLRTPTRVKSYLRRITEVPFRAAWSIGGRRLFSSSPAVSPAYGLPRIEFLARQIQQKRVKPLYAEQSFRKLVQTLPRTAQVCVRRQTRREVLFARGHGGSGRGKRPRFTLDSKVVCK